MRRTVHASRKHFAEQSDLVLQHAQIRCDRRVALRRLGVAAAEPAERVAVGDVQIERDGTACRQLPQPSAIGIGIDAGVKVRCCRKAGVARRRRGIFLDQANRHRDLRAQGEIEPLNSQQTLPSFLLDLNQSWTLRHGVTTPEAPPTPMAALRGSPPCR